MSKFEKIFGGDDAKLLSQGGATVAASSLKGKTVAIYFSAHWCPPCKAFTPQLVEFYNMMKATGRDLEIVFASADRSQEQFDEYFGEMPWKAFPFGDQRKDKASAKFKVQGIPTLVLLDSEGNLITTEARGNVSEDPQGADFPWKPPTIAEACGSIKYANHDGTTVSWEALQKNKAVAFYFSAHWCGPCRAFTPQLIKTYKKMKADGKPFEVVFVSSDRDAGSFGEYWGSMPWLSVPFADKAGVAALTKAFPHRGIPTLYIVDPAGEGKVITDSGRGKIMGDKNGDNFPWPPQPVEALGDGPDVNTSAILTVLVDNAADVDAADASVDALKAAGKAAKEEWAASKMEEDEYPVDFGYGDEECGLVDPIRSFCAITKPAPLMFVLDVPARKKFMWPGTGYPTRKDIDAFMAKYIAGEAAAIGLKDPVA